MVSGAGAERELNLVEVGAGHRTQRLVCCYYFLLADGLTTSSGVSALLVNA